MPRFHRLSILALALVCACSKGGSAPTNPGGGGGGGGNHNPTASINTTTTHLSYGGAATITVTASDPDGDQLTFAYTASGGTVTSSGPTATTATFSAGSQWGPCSVTVTASDGKGGSVQATATMYVRNPTPPRFCVDPPNIACSSRTYRLGLTPSESVILSEIYVGDATFSNCAVFSMYGPPGLALPANQSHTFTDLGCAECSADPNPFSWEVTVVGNRAEPDGGAFRISYRYWDPTRASPSNACFP